MSDLTRIKARSAGELLQHFELSDESETVTGIDDTPRLAITKLVDTENYHDAVTMLAHAMPKREVIWWACLCTKKTMDQTVDLDCAAVAAAELWVREPNEANWLSVRKISERGKNRTAAEWLATASSWCMGSMADTGDVEVPPPDFLYAHAVAASITLAAVAAAPEKIAENYQLFIRMGFDLAAGGSGQIE